MIRPMVFTQLLDFFTEEVDSDDDIMTGSLTGKKKVVPGDKRVVLPLEGKGIYNSPAFYRNI